MLGTCRTASIHYLFLIKLGNYHNFSYEELHVYCMACLHNLSRVMRKPDFCICENKDADQLRGNHEADQRLCFRYTDSTIPLLSEAEI